MATKLEDLRKKFPDYNDMSDEAFASAYHRKFYSDIPFDDFAQRIGLTPSLARAPQGTSLVESFPQGGMIVRNEETGVESFTDGTYSTSDPSMIKMIKAAGGDAAAVVKGQSAQEMIGEVPTRILSAMKGMPFFRGYVEPVAGAMSSAASQYYGDGVSPAQAQSVIQEAIAGRELEAPKTTAASRLATGIATAAPFAPKLAAESLAGKVTQGVGYGAPLAALEGAVAGYGEGRLPEAVSQAKSGGLGGALFGAAAPVVGAGSGFVYGKYLEKPVRDILQKIGFKDTAAQVVKDTLAMDSATAVESAERMGPYGSIAALGPNTEALLDTVANTSGPAAKIVKENLNETSLLASRDLNTTLDNVLGETTDGILTQKAQIMKDTAEARRELYGASYDADIPADSQVMTLFSRVGKNDMSGARELLREAGEMDNYIGGQRIKEAEFNDLTPAQRQGLDIISHGDGTYTVTRQPTVATIDYVTRRLYSQSQTLKKAEDFDASRSKRNLALQLRSALDDVNPDYAKARAAGKDAIDQKIAADLGNDILSPRVTREDVAMAMESIDDVGLRQLRQALRNRIDEIQANAKINPRADNEAEVIEALAALKAMNTRAVATKLRMALGDDAADALGKQINDTASALMQQAGVSKNSQTFIRNQVMNRMKEMTGESLGETVARQGAIPTMTAAAAQGLLGGAKQSERIRRVGEEIAPVLTQRMTPEQLMAQARLLEQLTPAISRAQAGGARAAEAGRSLTMGAGMAQAQQREMTPAERIMQDLGIATFR